MKIVFKCKYCNKTFESKQKLGGHVIHCKLNPNYENTLNQLAEARKNINHNNQHLKCTYCNKDFYNKGLLVIHEKYCINNPNRIISKTKLNKEKSKEKRKLTKHNFKHSEETKKLISEKRKKWLLEHKDEHVWRRDSKFLSMPCENLKKYLKSKNINFVEEYSPFDDINYCLDIAWPDEKIAIEVNGNQHYDKDGKLSKYYQKRHNLFESRGWKIFEIHYSKCYNIQIETFEDILKLPIYDKDYVGKYFSKKELKQQKIAKEKQEKDKQKQQIEENHKQIIFNLINNSGIDFSKSGWSTQATKYLKERGELWNKLIFKCIRKYAPDFLKRDDVWKRKGSKI